LDREGKSNLLNWMIDKEMLDARYNRKTSDFTWNPLKSTRISKDQTPSTITPNIARLDNINIFDMPSYHLHISSSDSEIILDYYRTITTLPQKTYYMMVVREEWLYDN